MSNKKNIIYLGCPGFPYGLAEMQKIILISKSLISTNNTVTVISKKAVHNKKDYPELRAKGEFDNIHYIYTCGSPFREENFFKRNFLKIKGSINEFLFLREASRMKKVDFGILSTNSFYAVLYYWFLSRLLGFKTILNYVEYKSGFKRKPTEFRTKINNILFDRYAIRIADMLLPISEFLINQIESVSPGKKYLKIPGLTDFTRYNHVTETLDQKYFLFCGAAGYFEIIYFIIDAFGKLNDQSSYLYLVINGKDADKARIKRYIDSAKKKAKIVIFSNLTEKELFTFYRNAIALLIPLRPTLQDIARFPHKTGEYLASGNPVISTAYGEMKFYFTDMQNMLLAESYDTDLYAKKMNFVLTNPEFARKIGSEGKKEAMKLFDYRFKAKEINDFLEQNRG
jgi:glycosyltransferase involved in cell wall biosynthesis